MKAQLNQMQAERDKSLEEIERLSKEVHSLSKLLTDASTQSLATSPDVESPARKSRKKAVPPAG
jgi:anion-transporting  ArsA/GET3 family ATPase